MSVGQSIRKLANQARGKVRPEQAERGVDRAADKANQVTGGKYAAKVDKGRQKAREAAQKYFQGGQ